MERILKEFLNKHGKEIVEEKLNENFILHLICLYEHQHITSNIFSDIVILFNNLNK